jgi:hypothetical protein
MMDTQMPEKSLATFFSLSLPNILLRLEGLTVFIGAIILYAQQSASALTFVALLLLPDASIIGYMVNPRMGGLIYNAVHTYALPALLTGIALVFSIPGGVSIMLIWFAHIGIDRALGFGLKYPSAFKNTHLQRV